MTARLVAIDATVLINLCHAGRLELLERLPRLRFRIPHEVDAEVIEERQRASLVELYARAAVEPVRLASIAELSIFAQLTVTLGRGESACIAIARERGWLVACDDRRAIREANVRLGSGRVMTTPGLLLLAIREGVLSIAEADAIKATLERHRFKMPFESFAALARAKNP